MSQTNILKRRKILVVEDETDFLELLRDYFKQEGFAIATARQSTVSPISVLAQA